MSGVNISSTEFTLGGQTATEPLLEAFAKTFTCDEKRPRRVNEFYYDTFDWRLYRKGFLLKKIGRYFYLATTDGEILLKESGPSRKNIFSWDFHEGSLRQKIEPITGIRAIGEILFLKKYSGQVNLLNKDRKRVVRLFFEKGRAGAVDNDDNTSSILRVVPVRGYEKAFDSALKIAEKFGLHRSEVEQAHFIRALHAIGREAGDYTSGFEVSLKSEISLAETLNHICLSLVTTIEQNYHGVLEDIDIEYLHDFRVAIRRTRSFLSQFKKFFPSDEMSFFQNELKWLGTITGPVRDLDVYLLEKETYGSMIPVELHAGLEQFFVDLKKMRREKFEEMTQGLRSARYQKLITEWRSFLEHNGQTERQNSAPGLLCRPLAVQKIRKCFEKILKNGSKLNDDSPDEDLHRLRIQGKKLRYLIEFFRSFFDAEEIEFFRKQLKKLQDMLGDFNDISVQLAMLSDFQQKLSGRSKRSIMIATAIGGLITHLSSEHKELRKRFNNVFSEFASTKNIERFYNVLV